MVPRISMARFTGARLYQTNLRGIPWVQVLHLTFQPGIVWKEICYDLPPDADSSPQEPG